MMQIQEVSVSKLSPHPLNKQIYLSPRASEGFQDLVDSIRLLGVLEPLIVTEKGIVLNGCRRLEAAKEAGIKKVPIRTVKGLDNGAQQRLVIDLNHHRKRLTSVMVREAMMLAKLRSESNGDVTDEIAEKAGFTDRKTFDRAKKVVQSREKALIDLMDTRSVTSAYRKLHREQHSSTYSPIIKPSDNWNFSPVKYPRIDHQDQHGYIPGDIYANCFWYFVKPGDLVVDAMAGSSMAKYVYERRREWMGEHQYEFELKMFDLTPQTADITRHDLTTGFPLKRADYIFLDLPYMGMSKGVYSNKFSDLANMSDTAYRSALRGIAKACAQSQKPGKLCTVITPNYLDHQAKKIVNMVDFVRECWKDAGYRLYLETFSSRRIQRAQNPAMAKLNNLAKERRMPLTDIVVISTFERLN